MSEVLTLAQQLIARPSITPDDAGCQQLIGERLAALGFRLESMVFADTTNLWARRGDSGPVFVFAGHTDVVPPGPRSDWQSDPFEPEVRDGYLYGRGAADMKGSLASMVLAVERFLSAHPEPQGSIAFLLTSDEEGPFINGTIKVVETLEARHEKMTWCIVGEPSSQNRIGDVVKHGRRGSLTGYLTILGIQGHVAYPHLARNPIHQALAALQELTSKVWDHGNQDFPPTSLQIVDVHGGNGVTNLIPGQLKLIFNLRFSTEQTEPELRNQIETILHQHGLEYQLNWVFSGPPFLTRHGKLLPAVCQAITEITGAAPETSTSGGTSDGRFIAPTGCEVLELGPVNATIHKVDECVRVEDLETLAQLYQRSLELLLT